MILACYKFESLPGSPKTLNRIRSKARLDCLPHINTTGYPRFYNLGYPKGQLAFYNTLTKEHVLAVIERLAEWSLVNDNLDFLNIYIKVINYPEYGYRYPNTNFLLSDEGLNQSSFYGSDCFLFNTNTSLTYYIGTSDISFSRSEFLATKEAQMLESKVTNIHVVQHIAKLPTRKRKGDSHAN